MVRAEGRMVPRLPVAASLQGVSKVYKPGAPGRDRRLGRDPARDRPRRDGGVDRPLGLRQIDAPFHPRSARPADVGQRHACRNRRPQGAEARAAPPAQQVRRLRLPAPPPPRFADGGGERRRPPEVPGRAAEGGPPPSCPRGSTASGSPTASITCPPSSPEASSSGSRSPARSSESPPCSSRTSPPANSTPPMPPG